MPHSFFHGRVTTFGFCVEERVECGRYDTRDGKGLTYNLYFAAVPAMYVLKVWTSAGYGLIRRASLRGMRKLIGEYLSSCGAVRDSERLTYMSRAMYDGLLEPSRGRAIF